MATRQGSEVNRTPTAGGTEARQPRGLHVVEDQRAVQGLPTERGVRGREVSASDGESARARVVMTVAEAAAVLGISPSFAYELCARGDLPVLRLGRRVMIPRQALEDFVASETAPARNSRSLASNI